MTDEVRVVSERLGGSPLVQGAIAGEGSPWYPARPASPQAWAERLRDRARAPGWLAPLLPAFGTLPGSSRLAAVEAQGGVLVTTGQQPGLFGGPLYTLSKALSALELADALQRATGVPTAPVFWAATDDADFAEASSVWVRDRSGARRLVQDQLPTEGIPMSEVPLEGIAGALDALAEATGAALDPSIVELTWRAYSGPTTVGGAYLELMRGLLEPLGIAVLDASHPALIDASRAVVLHALREAGAVNEALQAREQALRGAGHEGQVNLVRDLSLVFARVNGRKVRVPVSESAAVAARPGVLSPNVLLRPVVEAALLPTVAYVAGPGELAYFAQVGAVASAMGVGEPLAVPRWSGTVLEPQVRLALSRLGVEWRSLEGPHVVERQLAEAAIDPRLLSSLQQWRAVVAEQGRSFQELLRGTGPVLDPRVVDGTVRAMQWRADRLERRLLAAAKRREDARLQEVAMLRGALFPGGKRQERALSFVPLLAAHGEGLLTALRGRARAHGEALVHGEALPSDP